MNITKVSDGITRLTANIENILFEGFWEIPHGVSLNSYFIKGEKTALVDGVLGIEDLSNAYLRAVEKLDIKIEEVDYLIINHMEPDHSGWISTIKKFKDDVKIVCGQKSADLLDAFFGHTKNIHVVKEGDTLDLGAGRILKFIEIPNIHWPDTIATFDTLSGTLFSCDAFGSYGKISDEGYDDLLSEKELEHYESEALRYYANIIAAFSLFMNKSLEKFSKLPIKIIAPGHGIVWRKDPRRIMSDYSRYASYQKGPSERAITVLAGSMYGMTKKGTDRAIEVLEEDGITIHYHDVVQDSWSQILASVWKSTGIILAMPTYEYKMYPPMASVLEEICRKKMQNKKAFRLGSYGWSGGAQKDLDEMMERNRGSWEFVEPVEFKGSPSDEELDRISDSVNKLIKIVKEVTE